jgi:S1-C subfamily serine protease
MRYYRWAAIALLALTVVIFGGVAIATPSAPPPAPAVTDASVVYVDTDRGHGSGVHIGDGYVITAGHVADGAKTIQLKTAGGKFHPAEVLWLNKEYDIALLRTDGTGIGAATLACRYAHVGEDIRAIGNPLSLEFVSSYGRISGEVRKLGPWKAILVTDLTTVMGQSGGPVFDEGGALVGITVGVISAPIQTPFGPVSTLTGYGTIVPSQAVCDLMARV